MKIENVFIKDKYELIRKYVNPTGYKIIHWKPNKIYVNNLNTQLCNNKLTENVINIEDSTMFECFDMMAPNMSLGCFSSGCFSSIAVALVALALVALAGL